MQNQSEFFWLELLKRVHFGNILRKNGGPGMCVPPPPPPEYAPVLGHQKNAYLENSNV